MTDQDRWFMLYAQIVGIQHHPRNPTSSRMTPRQCVIAADDYMLEYEHRFRMADKAITLPPIETRTPE
jgi:hypothetical protein